MSKSETAVIETTESYENDSPLSDTALATGGVVGVAVGGTAALLSGAATGGAILGAIGGPAGMAVGFIVGGLIGAVTGVTTAAISGTMVGTTVDATTDLVKRTSRHGWRVRVAPSKSVAAMFAEAKKDMTEQITKLGDRQGVLEDAIKEASKTLIGNGVTEQSLAEEKAKFMTAVDARIDGKIQTLAANVNAQFAAVSTLAEDRHNQVLMAIAAISVKPAVPATPVTDVQAAIAQFTAEISAEISSQIRPVMTTVSGVQTSMVEMSKRFNSLEKRIQAIEEDDDAAAAKDDGRVTGKPAPAPAPKPAPKPAPVPKPKTAPVGEPVGAA